MNNRISWRLIFEEFKKTYPSISKNVAHWYASGHLEITVRLNDRSKVVYSYLDKKGRVIPPDENSVVFKENKMYMDQDEWMDEFSTRLCCMMESLDISQRELARLTGLSDRTIRAYLNGDRVPSAYNICLMAKALGCYVTELIDI